MTLPTPLPRHRRLLCLLVVGGCFASLSACSPGTNSDNPVAAALAQNEKRIDDLDITEKQKQDAEFMVNAAADGILNQQLATVALQRAATPSVRNLAQTLLNQYIKMTGELKTLAGRKGITLPEALGSERKEQYDNISALTGTAFDKKYSAAIVDGQKKAVDSYEDLSEDAYDGDIRGFAAKYLPMLQQQVTQAQQVQDEVEKLP
ncbi:MULTISPECIES: DUF4142 domain-containing protein [Hymenobacter]|uniref:DUF4142 domain-containing protein n=1 Tax=Hymenobacter profundi TaxID=1982110 RepID=A0ABS6X4C2_9BACT|nr:MULTISPECIES: DUF4142 domain-containing protein [Hymenobacter]MBW3130689.1 DUF4142 domain-containing protein [Hymenobacter profundi]QNE41381.1 DUF4142 domain-containing protein [Hymenobacter sp. NBH84]